MEARASTRILTRAPCGAAYRPRTLRTPVRPSGSCRRATAPLSGRSLRRAERRRCVRDPRSARAASASRRQIGREVLAPAMPDLRSAERLAATTPLRRAGHDLARPSIDARRCRARTLAAGGARCVAHDGCGAPAPARGRCRGSVPGAPDETACAGTWATCSVRRASEGGPRPIGRPGGIDEHDGRFGRRRAVGRQVAYRPGRGARRARIMGPARERERYRRRP